MIYVLRQSRAADSLTFPRHRPRLNSSIRAQLIVQSAPKLRAKTNTILTASTTTIHREVNAASMGTSSCPPSSRVSSTETCIQQHLYLQGEALLLCIHCQQLASAT